MIGEYHSREDNLAADWATDPCYSPIVHTHLSTSSWAPVIPSANGKECPIGSEFPGHLTLLTATQIDSAVSQ